MIKQLFSKKKPNFKLNFLLKIFKDNFSLKNEHMKLFWTYQGINFTEADVNAAYKTVSERKNTGGTSLSEIKGKIDALRNLIHLEEKSSSIFAIEILTEDNIKKYAEKNSTKKNDLGKIREIHYFLLKKIIIKGDLND